MSHQPPLDEIDAVFEGELTIPPGSVFEACEFRRIDLQSAVLTGVRFIDCRFEQGSLAGAILDGAVLQDVHFDGTKLLGIDWTQARRLSDLQFNACRLDDTAWMGLELSGTRFEDCSLRNALFTEARLTGVSFRGADLTDARFAGALLTAADARDSTGLDVALDPDRIRGLRVDPATALELARRAGLRIGG